MTQNNFFGFLSISDFLSSLFGLKWMSLTIWPSFIFAIGGIITGCIYENAQTVYILWLLMSVDWFTGIFKSIKRKSFVSYRLFRMPIYFLATTLVLSLSWWMSKQSVLFVFLPGLVIGGFYSTYFISLLENLGELEWLPKPIVKALKTRFGLKAIIDKSVS